MDQRQHGPTKPWVSHRAASAELVLTPPRLKLGLCMEANILHDGLSWFLMAAFVDGAFEVYQTPRDLAEQVIPQTIVDLLPIPWRPEVMEMPIFRKSCSSKRAMTNYEFSSLWKHYCSAAGFVKSVTPHRIRQDLANRIDGQPSRRFWFFANLIRTRNSLPTGAYPWSDTTCL